MCSKSPSLTSGPPLQDSIKKFERELVLERHLTLLKEKQVILKRQQEEVSRLMQMQVRGLQLCGGGHTAARQSG